MDDTLLSVCVVAYEANSHTWHLEHFGPGSVGYDVDLEGLDERCEGPDPDGGVPGARGQGEGPARVRRQT